MPPTPSSEEESLLETQKMLKASIKQREEQIDPSTDFLTVTAREKTRLKEVEARLGKLKQHAAPAAPASN